MKFCVDEVFDRGGLDMRKRKRGKSSSLGIPKAPQGNIQGQRKGVPGTPDKDMGQERDRPTHKGLVRPHIG